ncbi:CAP domain-containing protein [Sediminibacillus massiliensis]|uniref:CAP domain-containing protein n=1 Tax=Sediminibacillus massiliensis TaxID=1926277 RepID=UPI000988310D|nr:CAP domain-containing protein [Sediminibacillus massiliensis]
MRAVKTVIVLLVICAGIYYFLGSGFSKEEKAAWKEERLHTKETEMKEKETPEKLTSADVDVEESMFNWVGREARELEEKLGDPERIDQSSYGYEWWVFTDYENEYFQFGVMDGEIVTLFATGNEVEYEPLEIGQDYEQVQAEFDFGQEVTLSKGVTSYRFRLTEEQLKSEPLVKVDDDLFLQLYFDTFTNSLSSFRLMNADILLVQRPYEIFYRGKLPEAPVLTDGEWTKVQSGMEQQIFDITNIYRHRFAKGKLDWDDPVADVAFGHSKDMDQNNYFSHYTQDGKGLKERLAASDISYYTAGENIAAQYTDGPAAVEGWLNSEGHREALLKEEYTHLGVGVHKYYYTQNFLQKP